MRLLTLGLSLGSVIAGSAAHAQAAASNAVAAYGHQIDSAADAVRRTRGVPGILVLIAKGDRPTFVRGYGYADVAHRTPFTATTIFNIASNAKQFVAVSILQLAERGLLSVNDDVRKYVPELDTHDRRVTLRELLDHTSGLAVTEPADAGREYSRAELVGRWAALSPTTPLAFEPGTALQYRNFNYQLLALVLERVSGSSDLDYFRAHLFGPASMRSVGRCDTAAVSPVRATGYLVSGTNHDSAAIAPIQNPSMLMAAGGYCASAEDMLRWVRALHRGGLLAPSSYERMISPDTLVTGQRLDGEFGIVRWTVGGSPMLFFSGGAPGFYSLVAYLPATDETVITFANGDDDPWAFGTSIIQLVRGSTPRDVPATDASLARFTGTYDAAGVSAVVRVAGGHLWAKVGGTNSFTFQFEPRLLNQGNAEFVVGWAPESRLRFDTSSTPAASVVLQHGGRILTLNRHPQ